MADKPFLMKGHTFKDHGHKMTYPCYVDIKVDEIRLHIQKRECPVSGNFHAALSYAGKPLYNLEEDYRFQALAALMFKHNIDNLDCGVWVNRSFNDTYRYTRSKNGVPADLKNATLEFILFDMPDHQRTFDLRQCDFHMFHNQAVQQRIPLILPERHWAESADDVQRIYLEARAAGHEGIMVKSTTHKYEQGKRIYGWLKYKPEEDADGVIIALHEAIAGKDQPEKGIRLGDRLGRIGSVTVRCEDGSEATPHGIGRVLGERMLSHPEEFLGRWCEFKYMERDRQDGYRHPTFHRIREDKA